MKNINVNKKILFLFFFNIIGSNVQIYYPNQYNHGNNNNEENYINDITNPNTNVSLQNQTNDEEYIPIKNTNNKILRILHLHPEKYARFFKILAFISSLKSLDNITNEKELYFLLCEETLRKSFDWVALVLHLFFLNNILSFILETKCHNLIPEWILHIRKKSYEMYLRQEYFKKYLQLNFPQLHPINDENDILIELDRLRERLININAIYYRFLIPFIHIVLAVFFSTPDFANKTFFSFYDILLKNFIPLLLFICPVIIGIFLKIPIEILFKDLSLQFLYLLFINIKHYIWWCNTNKKIYIKIKEEIKKIMKNTKYDLNHGLTGPKKQVEQLQVLFLGLN